MLTVADVIALALPDGTRVVAGGAGLSHEVTWASRIRPTPPAFGHLGGGELVILQTSVLETLDERLTLDAAIGQLAGFGVAAVAVAGDVTAAARDAAEAAGLPVLSLPDDADIGLLERDAARLITERRREVQRRGQEVSRRLMELAIAGEPLAVLARELAEVGGRGVLLEGRDGRLLTYHQATTRGPGREQLEPLLAGDRPRLLRWLRATAAASPADPPTTIHDLDANWSRVIAPVIGRDGLLGSLSLVVPRGRGTPEDAVATARGAAACAVVLAREQAAASVRREVELHVLDEVLDGALRSEATLLQQAKRLGHDLNLPHATLVAKLDHAAGDMPVRALGRAERWDAVGEAIARLGPGREARPLWRIRQNQAEIVWPAPSPSDAGRLAASLHRELAGMLSPNGRDGASVSVGVGSVRAGIAGIRQSHGEAKQALALGRRLHGAGALTRFEDLGIHRLIFAAEQLPELRALYEEALGALVAYDRQNGADLIRTLDAFFAANGSPKEAADRLGVHRNTVLYRLDRIRDISGHDLDDAAVRLRLHLSLQIHVALGETG